MKEKDNKELIERMADVLREHSAPYKEGAWERFAAVGGKRKKIVPFWYLSGVAAMLLLGVALFINRGNVDTSIVKTHNKLAKEQPETEENKAVTSQGDLPEIKFEKQEKLTKQSVLAASKPDRNSNLKELRSFMQAENGNLTPHETPETGEDKLQEDKPTDEKKHIAQDVEERLATNHKEASGEDALIRMLREDSRHTVAEESMINNTNYTKGRKWNVGVVLAPALTAERLNMGGGVSVAYRISKKIAIGSGISLVDLGLHQADPYRSPARPSALVSSDVVTSSLSSKSPVLSAKSSETKQLTSINTNLLALDVPIDIKYQITDHFYVSAGLSFFAVLNEDRINNYTTTTPMDRTLQNTEGYAFSQPEFQIKSISEQATVTPYQGNSYSGFLNFSVGRKVPVFKKVGLSVEPFIKVPIGELSKQDMNLRYGGVRIITSF